MSSPGSDLSALNSDDFPEPESDPVGDTENDDNESFLKPPPSKRRRVSKAMRSPHREDTPSIVAAGYTDVSSDSSGSCPSSPKAAKDNTAISTDEMAFVADAIHICQWVDCQAGDLGDQDALVKHINDLHVPQSKDEKYLCGWGDCRSKTRAQLSAYALKAQ